MPPAAVPRSPTPRLAPARCSVTEVHQGRGEWMRVHGEGGAPGTRRVPKAAAGPSVAFQSPCSQPKAPLYSSPDRAEARSPWSPEQAAAPDPRARSRRSRSQALQTPGPLSGSPTGPLHNSRWRRRFLGNRLRARGGRGNKRSSRCSFHAEEAEANTRANGGLSTLA